MPQNSDAVQIAKSPPGQEKWRRDFRRHFKYQERYCGQGKAECGSVVSSGKLKAPSMALEVGPISNHCSKGMICG